MLLRCARPHLYRCHRNPEQQLQGDVKPPRGINASQTKIISALIPGEQRQAILLNGEPFEDVEKFKYLLNRFGDVG